MKKTNTLSTVAGIFAITALSSGYAVAGSDGISVLHGKCGNGKCGSSRVREMMDANADGQIDRLEYSNWAATQAGAEFDELAKGSKSVGSDAVFKHFEDWQSSLTEEYKG